ncbi:MAG: anthranilate phosphoribosyltransferase, partial [Alphaproteobacteria bacterium]|nr:anthranilate phosphoribosyltransferase [Alphaproteobacteria bacterium]
KHGNRAASSKSGAADVLEALGVDLDAPQERLEKALAQTGFAFLMAPRHHESMKHVVPVRKALGFRTIFNLLGPLANPAGTKRQLIGVYDSRWLVPMAETLKRLGTQRAWVVCGSDGLDEITVTGETNIAILSEDGITTRTLTPKDFGLPVHPLADLRGGNARENAEALKVLLNGEAFAYRDIVLANTAAVLCLHGSAAGLKDGVSQAAAAIDNGRAKRVLTDYIALVKG